MALPVWNVGSDGAFWRTTSAKSATAAPPDEQLYPRADSSPFNSPEPVSLTAQTGRQPGFAPETSLGPFARAERHERAPLGLGDAGQTGDIDPFIASIVTEYVQA